MRRIIYPIFFLFIALTLLHCGGDPQEGLFDLNEHEDKYEILFNNTLLNNSIIYISLVREL